MDLKDHHEGQGPLRLPLRGQGVSLYPLEPSDLESMAAFFAQVESLYYYLPDTLLPRNLKQVQVMMEDWNDGKENFVFACRTGQETVGLLTLSALDPIAGNAELGIMIAQKKDRGKGLASQACRLIMDYAFGELRLHRLYVRVAVDNLPSLKLFQALGFTEEGRMREVMRRGHGYLDLFLLGLLEDEYRQLQGHEPAKA